MFAAIARFDIRFRWLIVAVWFVGVIVGVRTLPNLNSVTHSSAGFLSASAPSVQAQQLAAAFGAQGASSALTGTVVAQRASGLTPTDMAAIGQVDEAMRMVPGVSTVGTARVSQDGAAAQVQVTVPGDVQTNNSALKDVAVRIRATFAQVNMPPGLSFHFGGPVAETADSLGVESGNIANFTLLFVIVVLFIVYRAALAPFITIIPAALSVLISQPLIAVVMGTVGVGVPPSVQPLLIVLLLGAGTDYGLFLCFRFREELGQGGDAREALVRAVSRVGQAVTFSGLIVVAALLTMLVAPSGIFRGLGPSLAIGIGVILLAGLTLMPALLSIFGRAAFWPSRPKPDQQRAVMWGRVAEHVVRRPVVALVAGVVVFGALATGLIGYRTVVETHSGPPPRSDSAAGAAVLADHFPRPAPSDQLLLRFGSPVGNDPTLLAQAHSELARDHAFSSVTGPVISPDGRTAMFQAVLSAGPVGSSSAPDGIPPATAALGSVATRTGAQAYGIAGPDATAHDSLASASASLVLVVPILLALILVLLGVMLRSLVAPWYLALTVGLSYLSSLGFAMIVFVHVGGSAGLVNILPLLMFVFSMALGEDYNVLVMSRIREEAQRAPTLSEAITHAIGITGTTITAAGTILAGAFVVLGLAGGSDQTQQLGFSIAFSVLLDAFFVRTLLVPSVAMLLGRWTWWPATVGPGAGVTPPGRW